MIARDGKVEPAKMGMWDVYKRTRRELEALNDQAADVGRRAMRRLDASPAAKSIAGTAPGSVGQILGAGRGVVHDAKAIRDGAALAVDLVNRRSPRHEAAVRAVKSGVKGAADYASSRAAKPALLLADARSYGEHLNKDLNPAATPMADSFWDEMGRRLDVGMNQGEAAYHVATAVLPVVGELKGAAELGRFAKAGPAKYIEMGASPELADYLATPYEGMGHHSIIPRRAKSVAKIPAVNKAAELLKAEGAVDKVLGNIPIPKIVLDGPFNVVKPNVERGQMYKRHFGLDDYYYGGKVPAEFGGGGWSGRRLGWAKSNPAERLWYGTPAATKGVLLGGPAVLDGLGEFTPEQDQVPQASAASPRRPRGASAKK
jgi:hypothetical protein